MLSGPPHNNQCKIIGCCCEDEAELQIPLSWRPVSMNQRSCLQHLSELNCHSLLIISFEIWSLMKYIRFCSESHVKTRTIANCFSTFNNSNYWHQWSTSVCQELGDYTRRRLLLPITLPNMLLSLLVSPFFFLGYCWDDPVLESLSC